MAYEAIPNTGSQLDRAICACLKTQWPGSIPIPQILPANTFDERDVNHIEVISHTSTPENPPAYDVEYFDVAVTIQFPIVLQVDDEEASETQRARMDAQVSALKGILFQTSTPHLGFNLSAALITTAGRALAAAVNASAEAVAFAAANADMLDFTCQTLRYAGARRGPTNPEANAWIEKLNLRARACPFAVPE